jgi:hypothetical protein
MSEANASVTREASVGMKWGANSTVKWTKGRGRGQRTRTRAEKVSNEHNDKNDENGGDDDQCDDTMTTARQMTSNQPRVRLMATARMRARREEGGGRRENQASATVIWRDASTMMRGKRTKEERAARAKDEIEEKTRMSARNFCW